jgi:hypothetical protein
MGQALSFAYMIANCLMFMFLMSLLTLLMISVPAPAYPLDLDRESADIPQAAGIDDKIAATLTRRT